ncbi:hypothetical protein [Aureimonas phyllosphaerae]|uniref:Uncharacterized protein n=1 Tax=Aureimonas phyllosphaerae TaxID=1166078 RepID=A0A7W6FT22_9HYPH|nr:hypothetical protein [Aureimonas phyllosphaerae]MBB3934290.1 hypothetical protein [Aureimonas phyllosphaerae]MBB3958494.1 hypothetical protein [Aureimonas phyllosphaerae]SFE97907.1 hypothetical protein SAMN05216566_101470 [Aureimonas phyllosphaerae]
MKGTYASAILLGGRQFGQDRYEDALDLLVRASAVNAFAIGDLLTQFSFFRMQAEAIDVQVARLPWWMSDEDKAEWSRLARDQYRRNVAELYSSFMVEWSRRAGRMPWLFELAVQRTIPLASHVLVFPQHCPEASEIPAASEPVMKAMLELIADVAGMDRGPGSGSSLAGLTPPPSKRTLQ